MDYRLKIFTPFKVNTSKCVNTIPIDNSCPKSICPKTTITFVLTGDGVTGDNYLFASDIILYKSDQGNCVFKETQGVISVNELTLTYVVGNQITVNNLTVVVNTTTQYTYNTNSLDIDLTLNINCQRTITLPLNRFHTN